MSKQRSYHDVVVYCNNKPYRIADNYAYELTCTRAGGWQLWFHTDRGPAYQIGGEYHGEPFRIEVAGVIICESAPST